MHCAVMSELQTAVSSHIKRHAIAVISAIISALLSGLHIFLIHALSISDLIDNVRVETYIVVYWTWFEVVLVLVVLMYLLCKMGIHVEGKPTKYITSSASLYGLLNVAVTAGCTFTVMYHFAPLDIPNISSRAAITAFYTGVTGPNPLYNNVAIENHVLTMLILVLITSFSFTWIQTVNTIQTFDTITCNRTCPDSIDLIRLSSAVCTQLVIAIATCCIVGAWINPVDESWLLAIIALLWTGACSACITLLTTGAWIPLSRTHEELKPGIMLSGFIQTLSLTLTAVYVLYWYVTSFSKFIQQLDQLCNGAWYDDVTCYRNMQNHYVLAIRMGLLLYIILSLVIRFIGLMYESLMDFAKLPMNSL